MNQPNAQYHLQTEKKKFGASIRRVATNDKVYYHKFRRDEVYFEPAPEIGCPSDFRIMLAILDPSLRIMAFSGYSLVLEKVMCLEILIEMAFWLG